VNKKQTARASQAILRAIDIVGSPSALADICGQPRQAVDRWRRTGKVPAKYCIPIETATKGAVTRHELHPDVFGESPETKAA
jgi:DNA-binding transcriptional regulator YdaS (Cro superfamily)